MIGTQDSFDISDSTSSSPTPSDSIENTGIEQQQVNNQQIYTAEERQRILQTYFEEREKFIKHLEKRHKKFLKKSKEDYDAARWAKFKPKKDKKKKERFDSLSASSGDSSDSSTDQSTQSADMFASTSRGIIRNATPMVDAVRPVATRAFSSSAVVSAKKQKKKTTTKTQGKEQTVMSLPEAVRFFRAIEIDKRTAAYHLDIHLARTKKGQTLNTRGRVVLPFDPRKTADVVLVFAEVNSVSARLARDAGVSYVGAEDLFEPLLNGDIHPTKVLCTPGMLPAVTGRLARFLGPKGLMPTVRRGGVGEGEDLLEKIKEARGATDWLPNSSGVIQSIVGRQMFPLTSVEANYRALMDAVRAAIAVNMSGGIDENLLSRRQLDARKSAGIDKIVMRSTNGPPIVVKEV